jgi:hypothetical protein
MSQNFRNQLVIVAVAVVVGLTVGYLLGKSNGIAEGTNRVREFQTVYLRQPDGTAMKKEFALRVVGSGSATSDDTDLRNDPNVWRIYLHEIDLVVYLVPRFVKD